MVHKKTPIFRNAHTYSMERCRKFIVSSAHANKFWWFALACQFTVHWIWWKAQEIEDNDLWAIYCPRKAIEFVCRQGNVRNNRNKRRCNLHSTQFIHSVYKYPICSHARLAKKKGWKGKKRKNAYCNIDMVQNDNNNETRSFQQRNNRKSVSSFLLRNFLINEFSVYSTHQMINT